MKSVNIHEAKTNLSKLVAKAAKGEPFVIAKAGKPMARLMPLSEPPRAKKLGLLKGRIHIGKDFDAPLPPAALSLFEGG